MKKAISLIIILWAALAHAQENIPIDTWRLHISYSEVNSLAIAGNLTYAASNNGLFLFNKTDNSLQTTTKINGLSDVGISTIAYATTYETLIIGYTNGNIDLLHNGVITNINTIEQAQILGSKTINSIFFTDEKAYLTTDFGVLVLDLESLELSESLVGLGENGDDLAINDGVVFTDSMFLATENGIISAPLNGSLNILDFNNWRRYTTNENAPLGNIAQIEPHDGKLYAAKTGDAIYNYAGSVWSQEPDLLSETFNHLSALGNSLLITTASSVWELSGTDLTLLETDLSNNPNAAISDNQGNIWIADDKNGMITNVSGTFASVMPTGPLTDNAWNLFYHNGKVFSLPGGFSPDDIPLNRDGGFSIFENGIWANFHQDVIPNDLVDMAFDASSGLYLMGSLGSGLLVFDGESDFQIIDNTTPGSPLESNVFTGNVLVPSLISEGAGVWIGNYGAINSLHNYQNGNWQSYSLPSARYPAGMAVASNNDKWIWLSIPQGGGVYVFNEDTGKSRLLSGGFGNGGFPNSDIHHITIDKEGLVWLGTGRGIAYLSSTFSVENNNTVDAFTPLIEGFPVLRDEVITVIKIDGGNRKWIGTENGVWLFDADVQEEIHNFNTENSPLLSNTILDIEINSITGEVFFATDKGIASFRSDATEGTTKHGTVKIFPNPVTEDFSGKVGITGLANNAIIKITDVSGRLVKQMKANGASTSWDVTNYKGNRVATGTYFVFSSSEDGEETFIGKIAVVN